MYSSVLGGNDHGLMEQIVALNLRGNLASTFSTKYYNFLWIPSHWVW